MELCIDNHSLTVESASDNCELCNMPDAYYVPFKNLFLLAYKKAYKNIEDKPSKSEAYEYVKDFIDIDISSDTIMCEDCIERIYNQTIEILQEFEE